jgi:glycosyltransferase involved in cell wall biosynthesis|tara:strand:+ start:241 stop:1389 length:1149 start_codon:yes stop_codon:yes gene_type:complete
MRILFVHNYYQQSGGEDQVFLAEQDLMKNHGLDVHQYVVHNYTLQTIQSRIKTALNLVYSKESKISFSNYLAEINPDIVHCHNFFPLLTPSIFDACKDMNIPSVLTLHNYRLICPSAMLMRNGKPWEFSINHNPLWTIPLKIYRNSYFGTASLAWMINYHKNKDTWKNKIDRIIILTQFAKKKFIEAGFSAKNLVVKPNFIPDPITSPVEKKPFCLFVGRLSPEKGIKFLLDSWQSIDYKLKIIGDGPLKNHVLTAGENVDYLGSFPNEKVKVYLQEAQFLVFPSTWYEGFPMVLVEALACGTPALVTNIGSMKEIIDDETNGLHFQFNDSTSFINQVNRMIKNKQFCSDLGQSAREKYLKNYTPEINYGQLLGIYQDILVK